MIADDCRRKPGETGQMHEPAATLDQGGHHLKATAAKQPNQLPGTGPMKFVYTTGARPLDGYTIKRGVGIGGFGEVYFATSDAGKEVAIKRIQRNLDVEIRGVTQCLNLKHSNLIAIYDIRYDDIGEGWIVMEFVSGASLKDVIDRNPNGMPLDETKFWFTGIAAGVAYLHDHGIVHRDLKPGNIFSDEGVVKIGDYGLSKFISCSRRSGQTESVGTFHYMAPEIGKGVYGKEIDIYALGIMLCEMLTGHVPFEGETSQEIIMKHLTADPDLHRVPVRFRRVIERALFKDPAKRFRSVSEMLQALQFDARPDGAAEVEVAAQSAQRPAAANAPETLYIDDEGIATDEIVFGPVVEVVATRVEKPPVVRPTATEQEPIAAAIGAGYGRLAHWWTTANMSTPIKVVLIVGAILMIVLNSEWIIPVAIVLGTAYMFYFGIRAIVANSNGAQTQSVRGLSGETTTARQPRTGRRQRRRQGRNLQVAWRELARTSLARKPASQRMTELTGALLMAAIVCSVLSLIILVAGGHNLDTSVHTWTFYAWLTVTSVSASWVMLGLTKFWEGTEGDEVLRRFIMMVAGLAIGATAFAASNMLMIRLSPTEMFNVLGLPAEVIPGGMYAADGTPGLTAFLAFFATLFVALRWWRQVDPLRKTRFSLFATVLCVLVAMLIPWQLPWGFLLAATVSVSIQLSAPWMNSSERARIRHEARAA